MSLKYQYVLVSTLFLWTLGLWRRDASRAEVLVADLQSQLTAERTRTEVAQLSSVALEAIALQRENDLFKLRRAGFGPPAKAAPAMGEDPSRRIRTKNGVDLKIFVYDLPADFNTNMLDPALQTMFHCRDSMYGAEVIIHEQLLASSRRTMDPEDADLFYVPLYSTCYRSIRIGATRMSLKNRRGKPLLAGRGKSIEEETFDLFFSAIDHISKEAPYWHRQNGRDHVFTFTHDFGACFTYLEEDTLKENRLQVQLALQNAILLQYLGDLDSRCFQTWKDIVIPPFVHNRTLTAWSKTSAHVPIADKTIGVYFRGKVEWDADGKPRPEYGRGVRKILNNTFRDNDFFTIKSGHDPNYLAEMRSAKLCLAPPGFAIWSPRVAESFVNDCIPLIIGNHIELPFEDVLDYRRLIVRIHEENVPHMDIILKTISNESLEAKSLAVHAARQRFVYNEPSQKDDAFDTILQLLAAKVTRQPLGNHEITD